MKKTAFILSKISYIVTGFILLFLTVQSARFTFLSDVYNLTDESVRVTKDSILLNICFSLAGACILIALSKLVFLKADEIKSRKRLLIFQAIVSFLIFLVLLIYVLNTLIPPYWDQMQVYLDAQNFNRGDYSDMEAVYLTMYPQQYGLIFFEGLLLRICDHYGFLQSLNALFIALTVFFGGRTAYIVSKDVKLSFFATVLLALNIPYYYYVSFVYGDVFFAFSAVFTAYLSVSFWTKKKAGFLIGALITACIMLPVRQNSLIFLIALVIFFVLMSLKEKKPVFIAVSLLFIVLPLLTDTGIRKYYELKSGIGISHEEIPKINWVVMGLQGDPYEETGVGYYNGYNYYSWLMNGSKKEEAARQSKIELSKRLEEFRNDKRIALDFFKYKASEQWNEPLFESSHMTSGDGSYYESIRFFYNSKVLKLVTGVMNYFQFFVYLLALTYTVRCCILKTSREEEAETAMFYGLFTIAFTGGFLFSLIWEAKGRYVFPFFVMIIPVAAAGFKGIVDDIVKLIPEKNRKGGAEA